MIVGATLGGITLIALAIAIDLIVGDPRALPHPVVIMAAAKMERRAASAHRGRWRMGY